MRYWALYGEEAVVRVTEGSQGPDRDRALGEPEPAIRRGGLPLPGLKHWRLSRGLSQANLARRADLTVDYLSKVESGRRGCNPTIAQHLADLLRVDLLDLRRNHDGAEEQQQKVSSPARPARVRIAHRRVHRVYLKQLLAEAVGSSYAAMDEREIEEHCEKSTWEGVLETVRARKREIEFLGGVRCKNRICPRRCAHSWRRCWEASPTWTSTCSRWPEDASPPRRATRRSP